MRPGCQGSTKSAQTSVLESVLHLVSPGRVTIGTDLPASQGGMPRKPWRRCMTTRLAISTSKPAQCGDGGQWASVLLWPSRAGSESSCLAHQNHQAGARALPNEFGNTNPGSRTNSSTARATALMHSVVSTLCQPFHH